MIKTFMTYWLYEIYQETKIVPYFKNLIHISTCISLFLYRVGNYK